LCRGKDVKPHDGSRTSVEEFINDPATLCEKLTIENPDTMERVHYSIQVRGCSFSCRGWCAEGQLLTVGGLTTASSWCVLQDTPGYGDDTDVEKSIRMIVDYTVLKNEEYFAMECNYSDTRALASREDPRVSSCIS
jgi:hypothetical protein